jgi:hypothetical protein
VIECSPCYGLYFALNRVYIAVLKIHPFPGKEEHNQGISCCLTSHVSLPPRATVYFRQGELRLQVEEII